MEGVKVKLLPLDADPLHPQTLGQTTSPNLKNDLALPLKVQLKS